MKSKVGTTVHLYPMPTVLVGATVDGKANFLAVAHVGILDYNTVTISLGKSHYTNPGIKENGTFSVNVPGTDLLAETDYCGIVSGRRHDKARLFELFAGELGTAPMIEQCPLCMECRVIDTIDRPMHDVFVGEVVQVYAEDGVIVDGAVDFGKVDPILFSSGDRSYRRLGERCGEPFSVGKTLKKSAAGLES